MNSTIFENTIKESTTALHIEASILQTSLCVDKSTNVSIHNGSYFEKLIVRVGGRGITRLGI